MRHPEKPCNGGVGAMAYAGFIAGISHRHTDPAWRWITIITGILGSRILVIFKGNPLMPIGEGNLDPKPVAFGSTQITTTPLRNGEENVIHNLGGRIPAYLVIECFAAIPAA